MNRPSCPYEEKTADAARTGCWEDSLASHVRRCADCRAVAGTIKWMKDIAAADIQPPHLPDPEKLFRNAQIAANREARERALLPLAIAEFAVRITLIFISAGAALWSWFGLQSLAAGLHAPYPYIPQYMLSAATALIPCGIGLLSAGLVQSMPAGE